MNKNLEAFFKGIKEIPCKNNGGCLLMVYTFWKYLKKNNLPIESFDIVQYASVYEDAIEHNIKWINKDNDVEHPISSFHFTWLYEGIEYDGEGKVGEEYKSMKREVLNGLNGMTNLIDEFCVQALNKSSWNDMFYRPSALEVIKKNLGIDMKNIEKRGW